MMLHSVFGLLLVSIVAAQSGGCMNSANHYFTTVSGAISCQPYAPNITVKWLIQYDDDTSRIALRFINFDTESNYDIVSVYDGDSVDSRSLGSYSGSLIPPTLQSSANSILIIFTTDENFEASGFSAAWAPALVTGDSPCYESMEERLSGPEGNFGCDGYTNSLFSSWLITGNIGERLTLTFNWFSTEAQKDILRIYDGSTADHRLIGQYSGNTLPPPITASGNQLYFRFVTDDTVTGQGFSVRWSSYIEILDPCFNSTNLILIEPRGYLGCPYGYGNNLHSTWLITMRGDDFIELDFFSISTEYDSDFVYVYDGLTTSAPLMGSYSGTRTPEPLTSSGNAMLVVLQSNSAGTSNGFTATYQTINAIAETGCSSSGTFVLTAPEESIGCDGYARNVIEEWHIVAASPEELVSLSFEFFQTTSGQDILYVFDGNSTTSTVLLTHSGDTLPQTILSSSPFMTVQFISSSSSTTGQGFMAIYDLVVAEPADCMSSHDFELTDISGDFGCDGYGNNVNLTWRIQVDPSFIILLEFNSFYTESVYDVLTIYDGDDTSANNLGSWSGRFHPPALSSQTNSLFLVFTSDDEVTYSGFTASYAALFTGYDDTTCSNSATHELNDSSANIGCSGYGSNVVISWTVIVPEGNIISLEFLTFETEENYDFVTIHDGSVAAAPLLGSFSGNIIPPRIRTTGNEMYVSFLSDSKVELAGFESVYHALVHNDTDVISKCESSESYILYNPEGQFGCSGYNSNLDSKWLVSMDEGQRITFSVIQVDTEQTYDYVSIHDGDSVNSPVISTFSGHLVPPPVSTSGSHGLVTFHSDASVTAGGFVMEYGAYGSFGEESCTESAANEKTTPSGSFGCNGYGNNVEITWHISTFGIILLQFEQFETEEAHDLIVVHNGSNASAPVLATFSGDSARTVSSSGPEMFVVFTSDSSVTKHGFQCNYASIYVA